MQFSSPTESDLKEKRRRQQQEMQAVLAAQIEERNVRKREEERLLHEREEHQATRLRKDAGLGSLPSQAGHRTGHTASSKIEDPLGRAELALAARHPACAARAEPGDALLGFGVGPLPFRGALQQGLALDMTLGLHGFVKQQMHFASEMQKQVEELRRQRDEAREQALRMREQAIHGKAQALQELQQSLLEQLNGASDNDARLLALRPMVPTTAVPRNRPARAPAGVSSRSAGLLSSLSSPLAVMDPVQQATDAWEHSIVSDSRFVPLDAPPLFEVSQTLRCIPVVASKPVAVVPPTPMAQARPSATLGASASPSLATSTRLVGQAGSGKTLDVKLVTKLGFRKAVEFQRAITHANGLDPELREGLLALLVIPEAATEGAGTSRIGSPDLRVKSSSRAGAPREDTTHSSPPAGADCGIAAQASSGFSNASSVVGTCIETEASSICSSIPTCIASTEQALRISDPKLQVPPQPPWLPETLPSPVAASGSLGHGLLRARHSDERRAHSAAGDTGRSLALAGMAILATPHCDHIVRIDQKPTTAPGSAREVREAAAMVRGVASDAWTRCSHGPI